MRIFAKLGLCLAIASTSTVASADVIFNGTVIPSADLTSITIDPATGDILINAANDWTVTQGTVEPPPPPPEPPPPLPEGQLSAKLFVSTETNPEFATTAVVDQWTTVTVTWQSELAVSCVTRLGTAEWQALSLTPVASGSASLQMTEAGVDIRFRMFCFDVAGAQVASQVLITVNEAPNPTPPPPVIETVSCDGPSEVPFGTIENWTDRVGGTNAEFPIVLQSSFDVFTRRNDYYALEFTTTDALVEGSVTTVSLSSGVRHVSVSQCPGNFLVDTPPECEQRQGIGESLRITKDPTATGVCILEPNKRYYLNVTYADVDNRLPNDTSSCGSSSCATRINIGVSEL
ncbi:MAG: hypothetical protein V2I57_03305 [Xanthomonadales bacterium]|jgi:hypothetical protein|nr:hypothetical protein [Xanthomonadales bacterium]